MSHPEASLQHLAAALWSLAAATPALLLALRAAFTAGAAAALYRALGEPGEGWGGGARRIVTRALFSLTGAAVFFLLTAQWMPKEQEPASGRGFQAYYQGSIEHRADHAGIPLGRDPGGVTNLRKAAELIPESAHFKRHLGIALADRGKYAEALKVLEQSVDILRGRAPERAEEEERIWRTLYGKKLPTPAEIGKARTKLEEFRLGWLARVAAAAAWERLPDGPPGALEDEVANQARAYFRNLIFGAGTALLLIPQLGLIILVVGIVLITTGVLKPAPLRTHPCGAALWESFIVMMALGAVPALIPGRPSPETQPGYFAALLLARDGVQLLAIIFLWWRLRSRRLPLAEVGLTGRHFLANLGIGLLAALVMIPTAYLIGIVTQVVSDRLFPTIAPPYHPLQGMTATSGSWEIRAALFTAAVIGAPLLEEIFFRGALFGALRRRFGFWWALLGSSAFFAILHPQLPLGFIPIAALGAVFAALYEWRQSLVPSMVAHAINNGLAFYMLNLAFPLSG